MLSHIQTWFAAAGDDNALKYFQQYVLSFNMNVMKEKVLKQDKYPWLYTKRENN